MFIHIIADPADLAKVIGLEENSRVSIVRYPVDRQDGPGELGGEFFCHWQKVGETPLGLEQIDHALFMMGRTFAVETCREQEIHHPCGCITRIGWAHLDHSFTQSTGCPTCNKGHRSNSYPEERFIACDEHDPERRDYALKT